MSDHWNELASLIGAQPTKPQPAKPEKIPQSNPAEDSPKLENQTESRSAPRQDSSPSKSTQSEVNVTSPMPFKPPALSAEPAKPAAPPKLKNHWQKVAGALGLSFGKNEPEPVDESPEPVDELDSRPAAVELASVEPRSDEKLQQHQSIAEPNPNAAVPTARKPESDEKPSMFGFGRKRAPTSDNQTSSRSSATRSTASSASVPPAKRDVRVGADADKPSRERGGPSRERSDSVEQTNSRQQAASQQKYDKERAARELAALFSEPADTSIGGLDFSKPNSRPAEERKPRYVDDVSFDEDEEVFDEPRDKVSADLSNADDDDFSADDESSLSSDEGEEPRRSRRRRRGGRRRRGRKSASESASSESVPSESTTDSADMTSESDYDDDGDNEERPIRAPESNAQGRSRNSESRTSNKPSSHSQSSQPTRSTGFGSGIHNRDAHNETDDIDELTDIDELSDIELDDIDDVPVFDDDIDNRSIDEGEEDAHAPSRDKRYRNVRAWKDTVGIIVDANLASRGSSPGGRGGSSGGRRRRSSGTGENSGPGNSESGGTGSSGARRGGRARRRNGNDGPSRGDS